jgi:hypothetical protein
MPEWEWWTQGLHGMYGRNAFNPVVSIFQHKFGIELEEGPAKKNPGNSFVMLDFY